MSETTITGERLNRRGKPIVETVPLPMRGCQNCKFWDSVDAARLCRKRPPQLSEGDVGCWPTTQPTDWCGEHKYLPSLLKGKM